MLLDQCGEVLPLNVLHHEVVRVVVLAGIVSEHNVGVRQLGYGLDLADLREYVYGDDVRHIDWNVTARLQTPYVREYNEEREVAAWFLLDLSPSVEFGSRQMQKRAVSAEFVAVLAGLQPVRNRWRSRDIR